MATKEKKEDVKAEAVAAEATGSKPAFVADVLVQPRLSEKSSRMASQENKYVFKVKNSANKIEVKKAVEKQYNVRVLQVNVVRNQGKKRAYGRVTGTTSDFKKAIVTLKPGDKIETALETV